MIIIYLYVCVYSHLFQLGHNPVRVLIAEGIVGWVLKRVLNVKKAVAGIFEILISVLAQCRGLLTILTIGPAELRL